METIRSAQTCSAGIIRRGTMVDEGVVAYFAQQSAEGTGVGIDRERTAAPLDLTADQRAMLRALNRLFDSLTAASTGVLDWSGESLPP